MHTAVLCASVLMGLLLATPVQAEKRKKSREEKQRDRIHDLQKKLGRRKALPNPSLESAFLHSRAEALMLTALEARQQPYRFDRLTRAADDLLESSERIFQAATVEHGGKDVEEQRREAARDLQKHYFRLQQADYFGRISEDPHTADYVRVARSLYQQARGAYDKLLYGKAEKLGSAAARIVSALENLAQARVQAPDPPRLD